MRRCKMALGWVVPVLTVLLFAGFFGIRVVAQAATVEERAEQILAQMTLEEKLSYIAGTGFSIRPIPRLGLPEIFMSDGPVGVRNYGPTTAYPAGIALAATWNQDLAARMGTGLGRDARARGVHILLGPGLNIYRSPLCGRNFEYLGEDPFLASRLVVPLVRGIQSQGVVATLKHFAGNNQEYDRHTVNSEIDERTLREIYLPAFETGVMEGGAGAVMSAYNPLNGIHCTQNDWLNNQVLKGDWEFDGILMSDWGATYDGVQAANGGLDLEMPVGDHFNSATLLPAIQSGQVTLAVIDDKVRRILRTIIRMGFLDRPQLDSSIKLDDPVSRQAALDIAREGVVLLKNETGLLPLDRTKLKSVVVIGSNAFPGVPAGGGSSYTTPIRTTSVYEAMRVLGGPDVTVTHFAGLFLPTPIGFEHLDNESLLQPGFVGEYFSNPFLQGFPVLRRVDQQVAFDWNHESPAPGVPADGFSVRWTGSFTVEKSGNVRFETNSDDGIRVYLDSFLLINDWSDHSAHPSSAEADVVAGHRYQVKIEYYENGGNAVAQFAARPHESGGGTLEHLDTQGQVVPGLEAEYFPNQTLSGVPRVRRTDSDLSFNWADGSPSPIIPADGFSARWTGQIRFENAGQYQLELRSDDGCRMYLDDELVIDDWTNHSARSSTVTRYFEGGQAHPLRVEYFESTGSALIQLSWWPALVPDSVRTADLAVVCVGFDSSTEGEGFDRTFQMPGGANDLLSQVAAANPNTVAVIFAGGAVDMRQWIAAVPAVVQAWYPGQMGGQAIAEILYGDVNPSGRLPATFEKRWEDNPSYPYYSAPSGESTVYTEGVFVGYRGFDRSEVQPRFPFGYGLSYTSFEYSNLAISPSVMEGTNRVQVSFSVKNVGDRTGADVAQLYIQPLDPSVDRPIRELKGFQKVLLEPEQSVRVAIELDRRDLAYYDVPRHRWIAEPGLYQVLIGRSSRDFKLQGQFQLPLDPGENRRRRTR